MTIEDLDQLYSESRKAFYEIVVDHFSEDDLNIISHLIKKAIGKKSQTKVAVDSLSAMRTRRGPYRRRTSLTA